MIWKPISQPSKDHSVDFRIWKGVILKSTYLNNKSENRWKWNFGFVIKVSWFQYHAAYKQKTRHYLRCSQVLSYFHSVTTFIIKSLPPMNSTHLINISQGRKDITDLSAPAFSYNSIMNSFQFTLFNVVFTGGWIISWWSEFSKFLEVTSQSCDK